MIAGYGEGADGVAERPRGVRVEAFEDELYNNGLAGGLGGLYFGEMWEVLIGNQRREAAYNDLAFRTD